MITDPFSDVSEAVEALTAPVHGLELRVPGAPPLDLSGLGGDDDFTISALGDDATWGNPESVTQMLKGLMRDGARLALDSWENRDAFLRVTIEAGHSDALAEGEERLFSVLGRRGELVWTPPDGYGVATVFDVEWSEMDHEFDDQEELWTVRTYGIRLTCLPFARSESPVLTDVMSAPTPPPGATVTVIDDGSSTTGWTATSSGTVSTDGTSVRASWTSLLRDTPTWPAYRLNRAGSFSMSGDAYLRIEWSSYARQGYQWTQRQLIVNSTIYNASDIIYEETLGGDRFVSWVIPPSATVSTVAVRGLLRQDGTVPPTGPGGPSGALGYLEVHDISRSDALVVSGGAGHQLSRTLDVHGSARTQAGLHMWHDTTALGDVLIHTSSTPNGMFSCEPFLTSTPTAGGGTVSGSLKDMTNVVSYRVPADLFDPSRSTGYLLMARLQRPGSGSITTRVQSVHPSLMPDHEIGVAQEQTITPPPMTAQTIVCLGAFTVPPHRVAGQDAAVDVAITLNTVEGTPFLDEVWFVDIETGALTWVNDADRHLWSTQPTAQNPLPQIWTARNAAGFLSTEMVPLSMMDHDFPPGEVHVYTVSTGASSSKIQLDYFPRWHTHARRIAS